MDSFLIHTNKDIIRYKFIKVFQDKIDFMRSNNQDTTQLTEILHKVKTDDMFLMQLAICNIDFVNSEAATADISTSIDDINDDISLTTSASTTVNASSTANSMKEC